MHRYGLVYMWHLENTKNKNRSITKERRDDEVIASRNRITTLQRPECPVSQIPSSNKSVSSHDSRSTHSDFDGLDHCEVARARREMQMAKRRMEKAQVDLSEAEERMRELTLTLEYLAGGDIRNVQECQAEIAEAERDTLHLKRQIEVAERQLNEKQSQLSHVQQRKISL